jgi:hypothetical protein
VQWPTAEEAADDQLWIEQKYGRNRNPIWIAKTGAWMENEPTNFEFQEAPQEPQPPAYFRVFPPKLDDIPAKPVEKEDGNGSGLV